MWFYCESNDDFNGRKRYFTKNSPVVVVMPYLIYHSKRWARSNFRRLPQIKNFSDLYGQTRWTILFSSVNNLLVKMIFLSFFSGLFKERLSLPRISKNFDFSLVNLIRGSLFLLFCFLFRAWTISRSAKYKKQSKIFVHKKNVYFNQLFLILGWS